MREKLIVCLVVGLYVLMGRWLVRWQSRGRDPLFALLTIAAVYILFFLKSNAYDYFVLYMMLATVQYLACATSCQATTGMAIAEQILLTRGQRRKAHARPSMAMTRSSSSATTASLDEVRSLRASGAMSLITRA